MGFYCKKQNKSIDNFLSDYEEFINKIEKKEIHYKIFLLNM